MKIKLKETTIEADAKELRECRTLSDALITTLRSALPFRYEVDEADEVEEIGEVNDEAD